MAGLAIGLVLYSMFALGQTRDLVFQLYNKPLVAVSYARAASSTLNEAHRVMERALLAGLSDKAALLSSLNKSHDDIMDDLRIVQERMPDVGMSHALLATTVAIDDWLEAGSLILSPPASGIRKLPMHETVERRGAKAAARLDDVVELATANGYAFRARAEAQMANSGRNLAGLTTFVVLVSALFALWFVQLLIGPIRSATQIAEDVAAGRIAKIDTTLRRDEVGRLLGALATMQANLRERADQALRYLQDREASSNALRLTNNRFDTALNNMSHGLLMWDPTRRLAVVNRRFCDIYEVDPAQVPPGCSLDDVNALILAGRDPAAPGSNDRSTEQDRFLQSKQRFTAAHSQASGRVIATTYEPMSDGGWTETHEDITERRRSEAQIVYLARHDALTRLPNRVVFQEQLEQAFAQTERGLKFALLYLDLDRFKDVNDSLGHLIGDALLCMVAQRLQAVVRDGDTVARLGGDEFAILQLNASIPTDTTALARRVVDLVSEPYEIDGNRVVVGTSIGIALAPTDGGFAMQLLKNADLALYRAKREGRGRWHFFEHTMDAAAKARRILELELRDPRLLQRLELFYQPVVSSDTMEITGFEALLRWNHPELGCVSPGQFIVVAEEIGVISRIGAWVLQQACAEAARWDGKLTVAVNLSPLQLHDATLIQTVSGACHSVGLPPERLILEITESALLDENAHTVSTLHAIHDLGIRIALDDFGTGYSSLSNLRSFPFDTIKIDRSFVTEIQTRPECIAIVRAVTSLAASLQMNVVAEGVETEEQFSMLTAAGCGEVQGYWFSRPVPTKQISDLIASFPRHTRPRVKILAQAES